VFTLRSLTFDFALTIAFVFVFAQISRKKT